MARIKQIFDQLEALIKANDHISVNCVMKWQYSKDPIFKHRSNEGLHIIHVACLEGSLACLVVLIEHGADIHQKSSAGWTALHAATIGGNKDIVSFLVNNCCADVWGEDHSGRIPAALTSDEEISRLLAARMEEVQARQNLELQKPVHHTDKERKLSLPASLASRVDETLLARRKPQRAQSMSASGGEDVDIRYHPASTDTKPAEDLTFEDHSLLYPDWQKKSMNTRPRVHFSSDTDIYKDGRLSVADEIPEDEEYKPSDAVSRSASDADVSTSKYKSRAIPRGTFRKYFSKIEHTGAVSAVKIDSVGQYTAFLIKSPQRTAPLQADEPTSLAAHPHAESLAAHPQAESLAAHPQAESLAAQPRAESLAAHPQAESLAAHPRAESLAAHPRAESLAAHPRAGSLAIGECRNRDSGVFEDELDNDGAAMLNQKASVESSTLSSLVAECATIKDAHLSCVREGDLLMNHDGDQGMKVYYYDLL